MNAAVRAIRTPLVTFSTWGKPAGAAGAVKIHGAFHGDPWWSPITGWYLHMSKFHGKSQLDDLGLALFFRKSPYGSWTYWMIMDDSDNWMHDCLMVNVDCGCDLEDQGWLWMFLDGYGWFWMMSGIEVFGAKRQESENGTEWVVFVNS